MVANCPSTEGGETGGEAERNVAGPMGGSGGRRGFRAALSTIVRSLLSDGYPSVERIAQQLQVPVRTLQRRLHELGLTYSDLVEQLRYREASRLLARTDKPVAVISAELGYADPSHFSRAFRRWSGMRPTQYRMSHRRRR